MISKAKELYYQFSPLGNEDSENRAKIIRHRRKRRKLLKENNELSHDQFHDLINHCLQEIRLLGHEHNLVIIPKEHKEIVEGMFRSGKPGSGLDVLESHRWDESVYLTFSNSVDTIIFVDTTRTPFPNRKTFEC